MPQNWKTYKLGEITELIMGQSPKGETTNVVGIGYPLLNGPTEFGYSNPIPTQFTTDAKKLSDVNDLLFCVRGSTTGRMNFSDQVYAIGRGIGAFRGKNGYSTKYVKYLIDYYLDRLLSISTGSTFPNLSRTDILGFEVQSCDSTESDAIAQILSSLDDKIELNLQMNKTLEEMTMTLYKHWFVDFGPFKDGKFIDSELGPIPEGWEVKVLPELGNIFYGKMPKKDLLQDSGFPVYSGYRNVGFYPEYNCDKGKVIVIARGVGGTGDVKLTSEKCFLTNLSICINNEHDILDDSLLFYGLKRYGLDHLRTGSAQPQITINDLNSVSVLVPPSSIQIDFLKKFNLLTEQLELNIQENQTLTNLRDTLLPKLISGAVRVKDVESQVAEVL